MVNTMSTFAERLKKVMDQRGVGISELARRSKLSRSYISMILSGKRKGRPSMPSVLALAAALEVKLDDLSGAGEMSLPPKSFKSLWLELQDKYEQLQLVEIFIRGAIPAGEPFPEEEQNEGIIRIPKIELPPLKTMDKLFALKVMGHSLEGDGIHDGDFVIVDPDASFVDGLIYIVRIESEVVARHAYWSGQMLKLKSSTSDYQEIQVAQADILGRVILSGSWRKQ